MLGNRFLAMGVLRSEDAGEGAANGGGESQAAVQETQGAAPAAAEAKTGLIAGVVAQIKSKAALNGEITDLRQRNENLTARVQALETEKQALEAQVLAYEAERAELQRAVEEAAAEKQTVEEAAAQKIASLGISTEALPAAGQDAQDTIESLQDKLKSEKDPKERFRIQQRIEALERA